MVFDADCAHIKIYFNLPSTPQSPLLCDIEHISFANFRRICSVPMLRLLQ